MNLKEFRTLVRIIEKEGPDNVRIYRPELSERHRNMINKARGSVGGDIEIEVELSKGNQVTLARLISKRIEMGIMGFGKVIDEAHFAVTKTTTDKSRVEIE